jgi:hypothetical protein
MTRYHTALCAVRKGIGKRSGLECATMFCGDVRAPPRGRQGESLCRCAAGIRKKPGACFGCHAYARAGMLGVRRRHGYASVAMAPGAPPGRCHCEARRAGATAQRSFGPGRAAQRATKQSQPWAGDCFASLAMTEWARQPHEIQSHTGLRLGDATGKEEPDRWVRDRLPRSSSRRLRPRPDACRRSHGQDLLS